jgi:hypothetical protein
MSAFVVDKHHIDVLVSYMLTKRMSYWNGKERVYVTRNNASDIGQILFDQNVRSVNYRYHEQGKPPAYKFKHPLESHSAVQIIKACHCLDYQSCETGDWGETEAWKICEAIISNACHDLPGYDTAQWNMRKRVLEVA